MDHELHEGLAVGDPAAPPTAWSPVEGNGHLAASADRLRVELIGVHLRMAGAVDLGSFDRISDLLNVRSSVDVANAVLLAGPGQETEVVFPELRVSLDDISIVGQRDDAQAGDERSRIPMRRRHLVVMTRGHMVYGWAHLHPETSLATFIDAGDRRFLPMTDVRIRWLADRSLAARYPFALVQRSHVVGVATEVHPPGIAGLGPAAVEIPAPLD
jgi:hypothetical protein